jgi:UDP-N-acetylglucosamine--N-acetylmuramyl-(pentapeptide) pyrophosphoryl-undecaprenol N-acetylglucosamine transferase
MLAGIDTLIDSGVQVIWQTGKGYYADYKAQLTKKDLRKIRVCDFLTEMDLAYAAADVVISRAGALAVSELCVTGKACILVPSPNVAEDHQTKNAKALVDRQAAVLVTDKNATTSLVNEALKLLFDIQRAANLSANITAMAKPFATRDIVNEIEKLIMVSEQLSATNDRKPLALVLN